MAKKSSINKNESRKKKVVKYAKQRSELKSIVYDKTRPESERFEAVLRLAELPRNSSKTRVRNRCKITGRPRGYHRKFQMSRIMLREFASMGLLPGVTKSSW